MAVDKKKFRKSSGKKSSIGPLRPALGFWNSIRSYALPAFIGTVIGGVALVAVGAHAEFLKPKKCRNELAIR